MGDDFLRKINRIKHDYGLTYSTIAEAIGVSENTAINYFTGRTQFPAQRLQAFCAAIGVDFGDLIETKAQDIGVVRGPSTQHRNEHTIPYFDVDVMATPIEVFNDQTTTPAYSIDMPGFQDCDFAINVYGHSMYPTIESGMIILCKKVHDKAVIMYGEIYLIVTDDFRMVKRLIKSDKPGYITAASDNHNGHASPDGKTYAPIDLPMEKISHLYVVKGIFKRCLI